MAIVRGSMSDLLLDCTLVACGMASRSLYVKPGSAAEGYTIQLIEIVARQSRGHLPGLTMC